jgi:hypothetical protein
MNGRSRGLCRQICAITALATSPRPPLAPPRPSSSRRKSTCTDGRVAVGSGVGDLSEFAAGVAETGAGRRAQEDHWHGEASCKRAASSFLPSVQYPSWPQEHRQSCLIQAKIIQVCLLDAPVRTHTRGPAAPARPQSAAGRKRGRGQQSRGLPVGNRQAKALARLLAADPRASATSRELASRLWPGKSIDTSMGFTPAAGLVMRAACRREPIEL